MGGALSHTHLIWVLLHYHTLVLFYLLVVFGASKAIKEGLAPWKKEGNFGMNTMRISSKVLFSYYQYSCAIELEYSFHVIIMTYELAYNFYAMRVTCRTLCLIIHITYMSRMRVKLRWWFIVPLGVPKSFTYRYVGSGTRGDLGSFCVIGRGARVHGSR